MERLQLVIETNDRNSKTAFQGVNAQIGNLEKQALQITQTISRHFNTMVRDIQRAIGSLNSSFSGLQQQAQRMGGLVDQHGRPIASGSRLSTPSMSFSGGAGPGAGLAAGAAVGVSSKSSSYLKDFAAVSASMDRWQRETAKGITTLNLWDYVMQDTAKQTNNLNGALGQARDTMGRFTGANHAAGESMAGSMIKAVALYEAMDTGVQVIKNLTIETTKYAAQSESYQLAMHAVAKANGETSDSVDKLEKKLKDLGISTMASRQAITLAVSSGMDLNKIPALARLGQNLAVMKPEMTSSQVFNNVLYGIQSGQTDVLRTVGLNVSFENEYKRLAQSAKRTTESLTEQEKMQLRVNAVMQQAAKYNGIYEAAMGSAGKQLQSLRRYTDDAKEAIGKNFVPAMQLVVSTATWAMKTIQENPLVAKAVGLLGSTATGAAIGGAVGGGIGAFAGGIGAVPGAIAGAKIGAAVGTVAGGASILYGEEDAAYKAARERYDANAFRNASRQTRYDTILGFSRGLGSKSTTAPPPNTGDDKHAKEIASAEKQARYDAERARIENLEGVQKLRAEHELLLKQLREEGVLTATVAKLRGQEYGYRLIAFEKELRKQEQDVADDRRKAYADAYVGSRDLADTRMAAEQEKLTKFSSNVVTTHEEIIRHGQQVRLQAAEDTLSALQRQEELALARAENINAQTLSDKLSLEEKKHQIHLEFIAKQTQAELELLNVKRNIAKAEAAMRHTGTEEQLRNVQTLIDKYYDLAAAQIKAAGEQKGQLSQEAKINRQFNLMYDSTKRLYDQLKQSADGIFDAMLTRSQAVWSAMANAFKIAFLTVFKEIVSSQIARSLTGLLTGQSVGLQASGTGGRIGNLLGSLGVGAVPVMAGGVSYPGAPGGTPGFTGPVGNMNVGGMAQQFGLFGGGNGLAGLTPITMGGKTVFVDAAGNIVSNLATKQAAFFGKFGKAGGAMQSALFAGGAMIGIDGFKRGGFTGMMETTAGGAMIGTAIAPGIGTLIGAGIGAAVGLGRWLFGGKSPEDKMRERIKSITGVDVREKSILKQAVEMAKGQFGGNFDLFVRSKPGQDLIEMYAAQTGQKFRSKYNAQGFDMMMSGGSLYEAPSFFNGSAQNPISNLPGLGFTSSLDQISAGIASNGPMSVSIKLDGQATTDLMEGKAVQAIVNNPRAVQASVLSAQRSSSGRTESTINLISPGSIRS